MATRKGRGLADPLAALPEHLRIANSPEFCACSSCRPELSAEAREKAERTAAKWRHDRRAWCAANDVSAYLLMLLERPRPAPRKTVTKFNPNRTTEGK